MHIKGKTKGITYVFRKAKIATQEICKSLCATIGQAISRIALWLCRKNIGEMAKLSVYSGDRVSPRGNLE
jgi:hypothetical protein